MQFSNIVTTSLSVYQHQNNGPTMYGILYFVNFPHHQDEDFMCNNNTSLFVVGGVFSNRQHLYREGEERSFPLSPTPPTLM